MSWWKWPARIASVAAAPFTGGASLMALPVIEAGNHDQKGGNNMSFWDAWQNQQQNGTLAQGGVRTSGINPNATVPGSTTQGSPRGTNPTSGSGSPNSINWEEILPLLIKAGLNVTGTALQARAQKKNNAQLQNRANLMDQLARDEMKRRDYYASLLLPNLLKGTGYSPDQIAEHMRTNPLSR